MLRLLVLIESDWNLKKDLFRILEIVIPCINRIRLEFKDIHSSISSLNLLCSINRIRLEFKVEAQNKDIERMKRINRIRLEFKVNLQVKKGTRHRVLIESDWNLKKISECHRTEKGASY